MCKIPLTRWIANAAARFSSDHGAVTRQAQEVHCSRQSVYDHAQKVHAAVAAEHSGGPSREELIQENQALRGKHPALEFWNWLSLTIEFPLVKQHEFSAVAPAMGLSLTQIAVLLALLLGAKAAPARSTVHRLV